MLEAIEVLFAIQPLPQENQGQTGGRSPDVGKVSHVIATETSQSQNDV
jgi:hypothetical protein